MDWKNRSAYVFIKTQKGKSQEIWEKFKDWDNVIGSWVVSGEWDVIVWFDAQDWDTIHRCAASIKDWSEGEHTSSHMVYHGFKNGHWWWEKPAGTWIFLRGDKLNGGAEKIKKWDWITSGASIPGDWDYVAWVEGESWDEVWSHLSEIKTEKWQASAQVPIKSWWNENWKNNWW